MKLISSELPLLTYSIVDHVHKYTIVLHDFFLQMALQELHPLYVSLLHYLIEWKEKQVLALSDPLVSHSMLHVHVSYTCCNNMSPM